MHACDIFLDMDDILEASLVSIPSPVHATATRPSPALRVGFVLLPEFTLNAFSNFIDALRLAADVGGRSRQIHCSWKIMGNGAVSASCGLRVTPSESLLDSRLFDYLAVCGGNGYASGEEDKALSRYLRDAASAGVKLVGVCTGTFAIARAGLMDGHRACVHWNVLQSFQEQFPRVNA